MDPQPRTLRDYISILLRRWPALVVSFIVVVGVAGTLTTLTTPVYGSSSEVLIQPRGEDGLFEDRVISLNARAVQTEIAVIEGQVVRARVAETVGVEIEEVPPVDASAIGDTDAIRLTVVSTNRSNAQLLADAYAESYISVRREQAVSELLAASSEVQRAIDDLQSELDALAEDDPRRSSLLAQRSTFDVTLDQLRVDAALRTGGATIIKSAELPVQPSEPQVSRTIALAGIVGILLGVGAALVLEQLDDKVRSEGDLGAISSVPVLAQVPVDQPSDDLPLALENAAHPSVEAYRGLRTNLQFIALDRSIKIIQLTSSIAGEGKTTTACNLAVVLAQAGHHVALIDADLRRPRVHESFSLDPSPGLTDVVLGAEPKRAVQSVGGFSDGALDVYVAGDTPANPSELLSGRRFSSLICSMGQHYDFVVVDSAPVLPVSDSVALSQHVDAVLLVAHSGRVTQPELSRAVERLERVSAPVRGFVLNRVAVRSDGPYAYGGYSSRRSVSE